MKTLAFFFLLGFSTLVSAQVSSLGRIGGGVGSSYSQEQIEKLPAINYPMKHIPIDSAKFREIFQFVSLQRDEDKLRNASFVKILQTASDGKFLVEIDGRDNTSLLLLPGQQLADGVSLRLKLEKTSELYKYTTVLGAAKTVAVYQEAGEEKPFTLEVFRNQLRMGETFTIFKPGEAMVCKNCNGFGKIPDRKGTVNGDGKMECNKCNGVGKLKSIQEIVIKW